MPFCRTAKVLLWSTLWASVVLAVLPSHAAPIRMAAGEPGMGYDSVARACRDVLALTRQDLEVVHTAGSLANLELLAEGRVDVAICQYDLAADGFRRYPGELAILGGLYLEPLQIVYPFDVDIQSIRGLARRRVAIGEAGSGTYINSRAILSDLGISLTDTLEMSPAASVAAMLDGQLDATMMITAAPSPRVEELLADGGFHLLRIPRPESALLAERHTHYKLMTIPRHTYTGQPAPVTTVGVRAVLLGRRDMPAAMVQDLLTAIYLDLPKRPAVKADPRSPEAQIHLSSGLMDRKHEMHPAAVAFFADSRDHTILEMLVAHWQLIVFAVVPALLLGFRRWLGSRKHELRRIVNAVICLTIAWVVGSILLYAFEHDLNDNFSDITSSIWSTTTYLFSGFEEKYPFTTGGRIVSVLMIIFGLGVIAFVTGDISSILTKQRMEERKVRNDLMENHILVVNWNPRTDLILKQICECSIDEGIPICVLSTEKVAMDDHVKRDRYRGRDIAWIVGDPLDRTYLHMVGAHRARSVLIMANQETEDPDAFTALIGLAIHALKVDVFRRQEGLTEDQIPEAPHVSAESLNHRKKNLMKDAYINEVVCAVDYGIGILAQTVSSNDISQVYDRLLTFSDSTNEVYFVRREEAADDDLWRKTVVGRTFAELCSCFTHHRVVGLDPLLLIGVKRAHRFFLNPRPLTEIDGEQEQARLADRNRNITADRFHRFDQNDMLVFLSFNRPKIRPYLQATAKRLASGEGCG